MRLRRDKDARDFTTVKSRALCLRIYLPYIFSDSRPAMWRASFMISKEGAARVPSSPARLTTVIAVKSGQNAEQTNGKGRLNRWDITALEEPPWLTIITVLYRLE